MNEEYEKLIQIKERYNILLNLLKKNISKSGEYKVIRNDSTIIDFLQIIEEIECEEMQDKGVEKETTEYPF